MEQPRNCPTCGQQVPDDSGVSKTKNSSIFRFQGRVDGVRLFANTQAIAMIFGLVFFVIMFVFGPFKFIFQKHPKFGPDSGLQIVSHRDEKSNDKVVVLGTLKNEGTTIWSSAQFKLEFYDKQDSFIDECYPGLEAELRPQEQQNFKIFCATKGTNTNQYYRSAGNDMIEPATLSNYSRYDLKLVDARAKMDSPFP